MSIIRDITTKAQEYLQNDEILLFVGSRQAGKTTILKQLETILLQNKNPVNFMTLEDPDYRCLLNKSPKNLLKIFTLDLNKQNFILIDEIQYLDNPSNFLKYFYDSYKGKIKILATGSSAFYLDKKFNDSLAGRKKIFNVLTLSFREFLNFKNETELSKKDFFKLSLNDKEKISIYYREYMIYGGYPRVVLSNLEDKLDILKELAYSYIKKDIYDASIKHDEIFYKLFKILASQIGNLVNTSELANSLGVSKTSIDNYLYTMQKCFHIFLVRPFYKNVRKELIKMPKVYFYDLGLRNFFNNDFKNFDIREDKGQLLENAVLRQFLEHYDENQIKFWRTIQQHEVDFVINDKKAVEVKVNPRQFNINNYKIFTENYPEIVLNIASLDIPNESIGTHKIYECWQI